MDILTKIQDFISWLKPIRNALLMLATLFFGIRAAYRYSVSENVRGAIDDVIKFVIVIALLLILPQIVEQLLQQYG